MYYRGKSPYSNIIFKRRLNIYPLLKRLRRAGYKVKLDRDVMPLEYDNDMSKVRIELSDGYIIVELTEDKYKIVYTSNNYEFLDMIEESVMKKGFEGLKAIMESVALEGTDYVVKFEIREGSDKIESLISVINSDYSGRLSNPRVEDGIFVVDAQVDIERAANDVLFEANKLDIVLSDLLG